MTVDHGAPDPGTSAVGPSEAEAEAPRDGMGRAAATITLWNLVSRLLGFVRVIATATALGIAVLGDTYQRTNQVSNLLFELLAGGMLYSVLIPTFVDLFRVEGRDHVRHLASALATRAVAGLAVVVAVGLVASRPIMSALSSGANVSTRAAQIDLGIFLLWFVLPQLLFYALGAVASALLQADRRFVATSLAPTCNSLAVTATMIAFAVVHDPARGLALTTGEKVLLGGGTLAGTVVMTIVPLVALRRAGLGIGPRWRLPRADLRPLVTRGLWSAGVVGLNEVLVISTVVLAGRVDGGVIAYQTAFTFFLLPHALLAHPIFTAMYPRLSHDGASGEFAAFARDLGLGLRSMILLLVPASGLLAVAAAPALSVVRLGQFDAAGARLVAVVLAAYLTGLAGYSAFFLLTRASYALGDARMPTLVNLWSTIATVVAMVVAAVVLEGTALLVCFGLLNAVFGTIGSLVLHRHVAGLLSRPVPVLATAVRAVVAATVAIAGAAALAALVGWSTRPLAAASVMAAGVAGVAVYVALLRGLRTPELALVGPRVSRLLPGRR